VSEWVEFNAPLDTIQVISEAGTLVCYRTDSYSVEDIWAWNDARSAECGG